MDRRAAQTTVLKKLDHLHAPPGPALAVDHLPAFFRLHPGPETDVAGALDVAGLVRVVHGVGVLKKLPYWAPAVADSILITTVCNAWLPRVSVARIVT